MRIPFSAAALFALALPAFAQAPATANLHASPADVAAALAKAKAAATMKPQALVSVPPYRVMLEYRTKPTPASIHEKEDELINVIGGSGTIVLGGTLKDQTRRNATNLSGSGIAGGKTYPLTKGSYYFVPAGMAHYFASMGPQGLTLATLHLPHTGK
jgi:mannose-6-phosphate isomerase-like protein (cupin superfamily)